MWVQLLSSNLVSACACLLLASSFYSLSKLTVESPQVGCKLHRPLRRGVVALHKKQEQETGVKYPAIAPGCLAMSKSTLPGMPDDDRWTATSRALLLSPVCRSSVALRLDICHSRMKPMSAATWQLTPRGCAPITAMWKSGVCTQRRCTRSC